MLSIDPRYLTVNVTGASGEVYRWGYDEGDPRNVPSGITISTRIPGGFATFDCQLPRQPDFTYPDMDRFAPTTVTGAGGNFIAFDGYLSSRPMDRGDAYTFSPEAIGWSGAMKDYPAFTMVYIDRMLSKWTAPSSTRLLALASGYDTSAGTVSVTMDQSGNPGIFTQMNGSWPASPHPIIETWYDAGAGNKIAQFRWTGLSLQNLIITDSSSDWELFTAPDDSGNTSYPINLEGTTTAASTWTPPTAARFAALYWLYTTAGGVSGVNYSTLWKNLAVVGDHGLTIHAGPSGVLPSYDDGFYGGDIIADIITRACPALKVVRGTGGITNDTYVLPQAVFNTPVDADTAVQQINQYYLYDYGVYEGKKFFWQPPGSGREWHIRVSDGVHLNDQGPQIETAFNGVIVQYTDPSGTARYVGPPPKTWDKDPVTGNTNSTLLQDTSIANPVNQYGRTRWALVQMGTTTWQGAVIVGQIFLNTSNSRPSTGTATVMGSVFDSNGREWPAWMIRAGDTVVIDDTSDHAAHYILETNYDHDSLTNTLTLDAPPNKLDWLLQRLSLSISPLG